MLCALSSTANSANNISEWKEPVTALKEAFLQECERQQDSGAVNLDINTTLADINDEIEEILIEAGVIIVRNNNQERFYVTPKKYKEGDFAELVVNGHVAERFPTCRRSNSEPMPN